MNGNLFSGSGTTNVTALLDGIDCGGNENNLSVCHGGTWGDQMCSSAPAGVACLQSGKIVVVSSWMRTNTGQKRKKD